MPVTMNNQLFAEDSEDDADNYTDEEEYSDESDDDEDDSPHERQESATPHQERTKKFREYHESQGTMASTVLRILDEMNAAHIDLPLLLDELSFKNQELFTSGKAKYARTALMVSTELPGILKRWQRPPRVHSRGTRNKGAARALAEFAQAWVVRQTNKEMRTLGESMRSPRNELSEENLLAICWEDEISNAQKVAPTFWSILRSAAYTPRQAKRNTYKDPNAVSNTLLPYIQVADTFT